MGNRLLALFNLLFRSPQVSAAIIVFFNFLYLIRVQCDSCCSPIVYQIYGYSILHRFRHRIRVSHYCPKHINCCIYRCTRKTNICCIWQRIMKIFCKPKTPADTFICHTDFHVEIYLRPMSLVRYTDNIAAISQKFQIFCEFLNSRQIYTTTRLVLKFLPEHFTGVYAYDIFVPKKLL